jgi:hypothetical protein
MLSISPYEHIEGLVAHLVIRPCLVTSKTVIFECPSDDAAKQCSELLKDQHAYVVSQSNRWFVSASLMG